MILAWASATFVSGLILGTWWAPAGWPCAACGALCTLLAFVPRFRRGRVLLVLAAALCIGLWRAPHGPETGSGTLGSFNGSQIQVQGVVSAEPDVRDTGSNYVVTVDMARIRSQAIRVTGKLLIHTSASVHLEYGDVVLVTARLLAPRSGSAWYAALLARRGIVSEARFPRIVDLGRHDMGWFGWVIPLRQHIESAINAWLPEPEAALLVAITLGARSTALGDLAPVLTATGLIHVIAISGIKVALVAGTVFEVARSMRNRLIALLVTLACLGLYVLLTGATVSGERSAFMWCLVFIAAYLGRRTVALVSLAAAAAVMAGIDPYLLGDIGFQLSTIGTFSIVALSEPMLRLCKWVPSPIREALCVTVAAQIGTLPIVIFGFHTLSLTGPLANALVLPLLPVLILVGFAIGAFGSSPVAAPLAACAYVLCHLVVVVAQSLARLPGALPIEAMSPWMVFVYYVALALVAWALLRRAHWVPSGQWVARWVEVSGGLALALALVTASLVRADVGGSPRVYWLGSDDALLLRGDRFTALIGGSSHPFALLEQIGKVLSYRVHDIDLVVVTDTRPAQITGLQALLDHYRVRAVWDVGAQYPSVAYARWRDTLRTRHIRAFTFRTGGLLHDGGTTLMALGPDAISSKPQDCIGLLRIQGPAHSVLVAGAADVREQHESVFRPVPLRAESLVLDGAGGVDRAFVRSVGPAHVWIRTSTRTLSRQQLLPPHTVLRFDL